MTHTDYVPHTDISGDSWVDRLPARLVPYLKLMRLDRPIGIWLLLFPGWWGIMLASGGIFALTPREWSLMALFGIGAVVMRGVGCTINDLWDRNLDLGVERTRPRPLPSGALSVPQAGFFLILLLSIGLAVLVQMNGLTIALGFISLLPVTIYPLMKRVTWWPQLFLGLTFNWSALMGWTAVTGTLDSPAFLLYAAGIFWTMGYDTIYAHQDKEDDLRIGIKSTAIKFGKQTQKFLSVFYILMVGLVATALWREGGSWLSLAVLILPAAHLAWQVRSLDINAPENCLKRFRDNRYVGGAILLAVALM